MSIGILRWFKHALTNMFTAVDMLQPLASQKPLNLRFMSLSIRTVTESICRLLGNITKSTLLNCSIYFSIIEHMFGIFEIAGAKRRLFWARLGHT